MIGLFFALGLLAIDAAQLRTLIMRDPSGSMAFALLAAGFAIMAGGLCAATAVLSEATSDRGASRNRTGRR